MIYDDHPTYAHHKHLRYAHEPYKFLYVVSRLTTTLLLVPYWAVTYAFRPRDTRPRASWNIRQIVHVNFTRRIFRVTEMAGVTWGTRKLGEEPGVELKETRFVWVDGLEEEEQRNLKKGALCYGGVESGKVGCFVWPKEQKPVMKFAMRREGENLGLETGGEGHRKPVIGIFMHGGGYCHMSAHEKSRTSRIPRQLMKRNLADEIYSVEYRLLQQAPFPAALQDAVAVYAHVVRLYDLAKCTILLIGDSSGGNLVLALARWIRDEGILPNPDGLLLLSPSCDPSHALPETLARIPSHTHTPRPNEDSDYLVDTPEPRAILHRTLLGFSSSHNRKKHQKQKQNNGDHLRLDEEQLGAEGEEEEDERELARLRRIVHSEYVSPCSPIVLRRWGHEVVQEDDVIRDENENDLPLHTLNHDHKTLFGGFPRTLVICGDAERLTKEVTALVRAMKRDYIAHENETVDAENPNPTSKAPAATQEEHEDRHPGANEHVQLFWARDACHDVLILPEWIWDRAVMEEVWGAITKWMDGFYATR